MLALARASGLAPQAVAAIRRKATMQLANRVAIITGAVGPLQDTDVSAWIRTFAVIEHHDFLATKIRTPPETAAAQSLDQRLPHA